MAQCRDMDDGKDTWNTAKLTQKHIKVKTDKYTLIQKQATSSLRITARDKKRATKGPIRVTKVNAEKMVRLQITVTPGVNGHSTDITFTVFQKDPELQNVKDGENGLRTVKLQKLIYFVSKKKTEPSHTQLWFYIQMKNDGKNIPEELMNF